MSRQYEAEVFVRLTARREDGTTVSVDYPMDPDAQWGQVLLDAHATADGPKPPIIMKREDPERGVQRWSDAIRLVECEDELFEKLEATS